MVENNAPGPDAMRDEFVNILMGILPKAGAFRAQQVVDEILTKQLAFYSQMTEAELDTTDPEVMVALGDLRNRAQQVITIGAEFTQFMSPDKLLQWQRAAQGLRGAVETLVNAA